MIDTKINYIIFRKVEFILEKKLTSAGGGEGTKEKKKGIDATKKKKNRPLKINQYK